MYFVVSFDVQRSKVPSTHDLFCFLIPLPQILWSPEDIHVPSDVQFPSSFGHASRLHRTSWRMSSLVHMSTVPLTQSRVCIWVPGPQLLSIASGLQGPSSFQAPVVFWQSGRLHRTFLYLSESVQLSTVPSVQILVWFCVPGPHKGSWPYAKQDPSSAHSPKVFGQSFKLQDTVFLKSDSWHFSALPSSHILVHCWVPGPHGLSLCKGLQSV